MHHLHIASFLLGLSILCGGEAQAQTVAGQVGFEVAGGGRQAGTTCSGFSCTPSRLIGKPNLSLTFTIRAPQKARYFVIVGPTSKACQAVPGFLNKLAVTPLILIPGTVSQTDTTVKCFGFKATFQVTIPGSVRKGAGTAVQVLAEVPDSKKVLTPAFSSPIDIIVL